MTIALIVLPPPFNTSVQRLNITHMIVSWTLLKLADLPGFVHGYSITYHRQLDENNIVVEVSNATSSVVIGGLGGDVAYVVTVASYNINGLGQTAPALLVKGNMLAKSYAMYIGLNYGQF